jgi:transcriptional regulator with XRE-family HTH domain
MNHNELKKHFGSRLYEIRMKRDFSQEKLAGLVGLTRFAISKIENGVHGAHFETIAALSSALGVRAAYFFEEDNPQENND